MLNLSPDELLGQATAAAVAKAAGLNAGAAAAPATRKLAAAASQEVSDLLSDAEAVMDVLNLKLADHSRHQEMIRSVQWALIRKKQVVGQYASPYQEKPVKLALHLTAFVLPARHGISLPAVPRRSSPRRTGLPASNRCG